MYLDGNNPPTTLVSGNQPGTSYGYSGLSGNTTYYWKVLAKNVGGNTTATDAPWSFTTVASLPNSVTLVYPPDKEVIGVDSVLFVWGHSQPMVTHYRIDLSIDSSFDFMSVDTNVTETFLIRRSLNRGSYWWRVRAANEGGWGPSSEVRRFTILLTGVEDQGIMPTRFSLEQNYPNPFNPSTIIRYAIPNAAFVSLKVYNMLGQEVALLVHEHKMPGRYEARFNGDALPSGLYFYRLQAGSFVETRKLALMK